MSTLGERIITRRKELGLKQCDLAEKTGLAKSTICRYEKDQQLPTSYCLDLLATALNVSLDYIFYGDREKTS